MSFASLRREAAFAAGVLRRRPFNVLVQVTNRCNLTCGFCDFWPNGANPRDELKTEDFERLSDALAGLGTFLVSVEGGEPLVRPDLPRIIAAFARHHLPVLYTNGWLVDARRARELFEAGLSQAGVSIDHPDGAEHDRKRGAAGTAERAWRAVGLLRDAGGGRRVHVMTILKADTMGGLDELLARSRDLGVGHQVTLLSVGGFRRRSRPDEDALPERIGDRLRELRAKYPHLRTFRDYLDGMDAFLDGGADLPRCRAGVQSFNVDHLGNVSPCIEKIDRTFGNVRDEPLAAIHARMSAADAGSGCQACWTLCRGTAQALGGGGTPRGWIDISRA